MIGIATYTRLSEDTTVANMVEDRIYPHQVPPEIEAVTPYIVYEIQSRESSRTYTHACTLWSQKVAIYCVGTSYDQCKGLGDAVFHAMEMGEWDFEGGRVTGAFFDDDSSDGVVSVADSEQCLWIEEQVYNIWIQEASSPS